MQEYFMNQPYTYLIGWSKLDRWYYGVRYSINCNPNDLWNPYKTSSEIVKKFLEEHGEPDIITVRKIFADVDSAKIWEEKVLKRMHVVSSPKWLNMNDRQAPPILFGHVHNRGRKQSPETMEKRRQTMLATMSKKFPIENRRKCLPRDSQELIEVYRQRSLEMWENRSEEVKKEISQKISEKNKGLKNRLGQTNSEEHRKKASESIKAAFAAAPEKTNAGKFWWNNGLINKRSKESPGPEWIKGKMPHNKSYNSEKMKEIWSQRKAGILPMPVYGG